jgi:pSer/pThr/pTyr-binding forkhead associated (FHA) protein
VEIDDPTSITIPRSYALLTIVNGPEEQYLALFGEEISLGRSPECDIQLNDTACSRFHAAIVADADGHLIKDLNSQNGVYVNQERIYEQRKLRDGDQFTLGETLLKYQPAQTAGIKSASGD